MPSKFTESHMRVKCDWTRLFFLLPFWFAPSVFAEAPSGRSEYAQLDEAKVHYTNYGAGERALVLVHGWSCDENFWRDQVPAFADKMRVITIDLPGHGQSEKPRINYTMDLYARAIDAVLQNAKVKSAVLVGHSNGTPVIREFYRKFPEKVSALVIVDGALRALFEAADLEKFIAPMRGPDYEKSAGQFIDFMVKPIAEPAKRAWIKTEMLKTPQYVGVSELENTVDRKIWTPDKINVPVLAIYAKQPAWTAEYEQFVRGLAPDLDFQMWDGVSHFLMMDKPERFNAALLAFLQTHHLLD